jgi:hypothetical protein
MEVKMQAFEAATPVFYITGGLIALSMLTLMFSCFWVWWSMMRCCRAVMAWIAAYRDWVNRQLQGLGWQQDPNDPPPGIPSWP